MGGLSERELIYFFPASVDAAWQWDFKAHVSHTRMRAALIRPHRQQSFESVLWFFIKDLRQAVRKKKKKKTVNSELSTAPPCGAAVLIHDGEKGFDSCTGTYYRHDTFECLCTCDLCQIAACVQNWPVCWASCTAPWPAGKEVWLPLRHSNF